MRVAISDHGELACDVLGGGVPVVFVHGFPMCGLMWMHAAHRLPAGFRAIVPDLRGHGASSVHRTLSIRQMADDLVEMLDAVVPNQRAVCVGLSMGGMICFELWRRYPERVAALVLCNTRTNAETGEGVARRTQIAQLALHQGSGAVVDAMLPGIFAPGLDPVLRQRWREHMSRTHRVTIAAASMALAERADSSGTLPTISCPTLVVAGDEDALTPAASMAEIHRQIPLSRMVVIKGAGHVPPVEKPGEFSAALNEFLQGIAMAS